ncbi:thioesterase II family protein [Streptomyces sp. NBC_01803]|uniref:thioesterase II family protein n=1 Tax=Streptomyces sp. NBC_01803 TaxID=2975946 RepID=UPI002DDADEDC|nr:alpha/beta fold hydrolase [Streptomyces sp. NBC_01803]WSA43160.1 alpha/beta fold hydrolase [Streptomyces sp. NBC_01803]
MRTADPFVRPRALRDPALRLVVFPHAGGSGNVYYPMTRHLPESWDLLLLDLPGRGRRYASAPVPDMATLVALVTEDVLSEAGAGGRDTPLVLFGHSLGAIVAAETARSLTARGGGPAWLGVSGRVAPGRPPGTGELDPALPDAELAGGLARLGGLPDRLDELPEFRDRFIRLVRSDLRALASYRPDPLRRPLDCPVTAFAAADDALAPPSGLTDWAAETSGPFRHRVFPGGHFHFLGEGFPAFTEALVAEIRAAVPLEAAARGR